MSSTDTEIFDLSHNFYKKIYRAIKTTTIFRELSLQAQLCEEGFPV